MVIGVGVDIVAVSRFARIVARPSAQRFLDKVLHPIEQEEFNAKESDMQKYQFLASRWALKEAMVKATKDGKLFYPGMYLEKKRNEEGRVVQVKMAIDSDLNEDILSRLGVNEIHSSISHEEDYAVAFVTLV